jgi:hypothetical protein
MVKENMVACVECGKRLGFFEGHYHPTLGKKSLLCYSCFVKVDESVTQWREFVLSNSFNTEPSKSTLGIDQSSLIARIVGVQKRLNAIR